VQRFKARWLLPIDAAPIAYGALLVDDAGNILQVGPDDVVPIPPDAAAVDLGDAVLLPGLVNTHSHLELTGFAGKVNEASFLDWIAGVIRIKSGRSEQDFFDAACDGVRLMWRSGVTTVCDTGSTGSVIAALDHLGASGIYHHEVFGAHPDQCQPAMRHFEADLNRLARHAVGRVGLGVSPHAPYTVSGALYAASADLARAHGVPMAVHVAEPAGEGQLLRDFEGIFAEDFKRRGIPRPSPEGDSPIRYLERHRVLSDRTLCIHVIDVDDADADVMARHGVAVAHCPRSNRFHHHAEAPVRRYLDRNLRLGLGTDSEISVDPPDLIAEAREARRLAGWSARDALRALTLGGAEAIERDAETGSLTPGKRADLVAIRVPETTDPEEAVLAAGPEQVAGTWLAGHRVHQAG
jgi:cytosine/adenosine deaminase-related metal-dependent hydrolase